MVLSRRIQEPVASACCCPETASFFANFDVKIFSPKHATASEGPTRQLQVTDVNVFQETYILM